MADAPIVIDVRTEHEWQMGHIEKAIHLSVGEILSGKVPVIDKDSTIYLYCRSGSRAETAKLELLRQGYKNVENIGSLQHAAHLFGDLVQG